MENDLIWFSIFYNTSRNHFICISLHQVYFSCSSIVVCLYVFLYSFLVSFVMFSISLFYFFFMGFNVFLALFLNYYFMFLSVFTVMFIVHVSFFGSRCSFDVLVGTFILTHLGSCSVQYRSHASSSYLL